MNYKEMNYKEKQAFKASLKPSQRTKLNKMEKEAQEQIQPMMWARGTRQEEVRKEAWTALNCAERIKAVEEAHAPKIQALRDQFKALQEELAKAQEELAEERSKIQTEPYTASYDDPQVKAIEKIWGKIKEAQEVKMQNLVDSFKEKVSN
jgi:hypothetical protein